MAHKIDDIELTDDEAAILAHLLRESVAGGRDPLDVEELDAMKHKWAVGHYDALDSLWGKLKGWGPK